MVGSGKRQQDAASAVGVTRQVVSGWMKLYASGGETALDGKKRGRRAGEQKALTSAQETKIRRLISDKCPDQLKLPFALWTREAVAELIECESSGSRLAASAVEPTRSQNRTVICRRSAV